MKLVCSVIMPVFFLLICTSCSTKSTISQGTYLLQAQENTGAILPSVTIDGENIMFSFDPLSSYANIGGFTIEKDRLIMTSSDKRYTYVFEINEESLYFLEDESSDIHLTDPRIGYEISDFAEFSYSE